jgi:plasmid stabilization system protein ParE
MKRIAYRRYVVREIRDAAAWYEQQRLGLGNDFYNQIVACIQGIQSNPYCYAPVHEDIREGVPDRFPYRVYYRIRNN